MSNKRTTKIFLDELLWLRNANKRTIGEIHSSSNLFGLTIKKVRIDKLKKPKENHL